MTTISTIATTEGTINIDSEKMVDFCRRSRNILLEIGAGQDMFKDLVQEIADETKMKKGKISAYLKTRHKAEFKPLKEKVDLFEKLNHLIDGKPKKEEE